MRKEEYIQPPENYTPHVTSNGFSKKTKVGMGVAIIVGAFLILVGVGGSLSQQQTGTLSGLIEMAKKSNEPFTGELTQLLPTRDDIGTEWKFGHPSGISGGIDPKASDGLIVGASDRYMKGEGFDISIITLQIYKFNSNTNAMKYYDDFISAMREKGGYKEWSPSGIPSDKCYGKTNYVTIYCIKNNIIVSSTGWSEYNDMKEDVTNFAKIVVKKLV